MDYIQVEEPNPGFQTCGLVVDERLKWGHSDQASKWTWEVHIRIFKSPNTNILVVTDLHKGQSVTNGIERILEVAYKKWANEIRFCQFVQHNPRFTWRDERFSLVTFNPLKGYVFKLDSPQWKDLTKDEVEAMCGWKIDFPAPARTQVVNDLDECFKIALPDNLPQELVAALLLAENKKPFVYVGSVSGVGRKGYLTVVPHREVVGLSELVLVGPNLKLSNTENAKVPANAYLDWSQVDFLKQGKTVVYQKNYSQG